MDRHRGRSRHRQHHTRSRPEPGAREPGAREPEADEDAPDEDWDWGWTHPHAWPRPRRRKPLTPEQRAYRQARRRANAKFGFLVHFLVYAFICTMLFAGVHPRVGLIVGFGWGTAVALHYLFALKAPELRQRWIEQEVDRQVSRSVSSERQEMHGEHSRNVEALSASIAHEIRNPITAAKSLVQQLGEDPRADENVEYAKVALEELDRVERSISHLLRFAREEEMEMQPLLLAEVVESALETFRSRLDADGVEVVRNLDGDCPMRGDADKLRRVVINVFGNALDALSEAGVAEPCIAVSGGENLAGNEVWLRVRDNGPGIEAERLERIFNPFYTSKADGTGLGLAISKKLVDAHGGRIEAHSTPGAGTEFVLGFPKGAGGNGSAS